MPGKLPRISLAMISKGEEGLGRCIKSAQPLIDEVVICHDPADRRAVQAQLPKLKGVPFHLVERRWDDSFGAQREASFAACRNEWAMWLDSDDELVGAEALKKWLEENLPETPVQVCLTYVYEEDCVQIRERIVPRSRGRWGTDALGPFDVHEIWLARDTPKLPVLLVPREVAHVKHHFHSIPEQERLDRRRRNLRLLRKHVDRADQAGVFPDRRLVSQMIDALIDEGAAPEALEAAKALLPREPRGACRCRLFRQMAEIHSRLGAAEAARDCAGLAVLEVPRDALARRTLIEACRRLGRNDEALWWYRDTYEHGLQVTGDALMHAPSMLKADPLLAANILLDLGRFDEAKVYADKAGDAVLSYRVAKVLEEEKAALGFEAAMQIHESENKLLKPDEDYRRQLAKMAPLSIRQYPQVGRWLLPELPKDRRSVAIFCGTGGGMYDVWGPDSVKTGIGGSEEAVIRVAPELVKAGLHVECYGPWPRDEVRDGVHWIHATRWNPSRPVDLFLAWRYEGFLAAAPAAKRRAVWCHDLVNPAQGFELADELWCLSEAHADLTRRAVGAKNAIWVTRNGITDVPRPEAATKRPGKVVFGSSPDRGMDIMLKLWPRVLEQVPEAELHLFYGFPPSYLRAETARPELAELRREIEGLVESTPRVVWHGMVGQPELHRHLAEAHVWAYPVHWYETSCITAMKAQAAGAWPVTTPITALAETIVWGDKLPLPPAREWTAAETEQYLAALVKALKTPWSEFNWTPDLADRFSWSGVAAEWKQHLEESLNGDPGSPAVVGTARASQSLAARDGGPGSGDLGPVDQDRAEPGREPAAAGAAALDGDGGPVAGSES